MAKKEEKKMNLIDAIHHLNEKGGKVRSVLWKEDEYLTKDKGVFIKASSLRGKEIVTKINIIDIDDEFEVVKEKKATTKKVDKEADK